MVWRKILSATRAHLRGAVEAYVAENFCRYRGVTMICF